jgi:hypothetical protein
MPDQKTLFSIIFENTILRMFVLGGDPPDTVDPRSCWSARVDPRKMQRCINEFGFKGCGVNGWGADRPMVAMVLGAFVAGLRNQGGTVYFFCGFRS